MKVSCLVCQHCTPEIKNESKEQGHIIIEIEFFLVDD